MTRPLLVTADECADESRRERFWAKVRKTDDCWFWTAAGDPDSGYGVFSWRRPRNTLAHRAAYQLTYGPLPAGVLVLHHCDNPQCVRPDHLFAGTQLDNIHDMITKGRDRGGFHRFRPVQIGERNNRAVLRDADVVLIREMSARGLTGIAISRHFGISPSTVSTVLVGKRWSHVA